MERKKIQLQYQLKPTSEMILWDAISTPSGLESWFADKVIMTNNREVTFRWADEEKHAKVVGFRSFSYIRFRSGMSSLEKGHQVAQFSSTVTLFLAMICL